MSKSQHHPSSSNANEELPQELPEILPIFPLTGSLLLPGNWLPLNIFEPRYRNMIEDAMAGERVIGLIQPLEPRQDNHPQPGAELEAPTLYEVGCVGRIEECQQTSDGRFVIALVGVRRFRIEREMPPFERGYRRVEVDYAAFSDTLSEGPGEPASEELIGAVTEFATAQGLKLDMDRLETLPERVLVNGLAVALPFAPAEKQALLERSEDERREVLLSLLSMGLDATAPAGTSPQAN